MNQIESLHEIKEEVSDCKKHLEILNRRHQEALYGCILPIASEYFGLRPEHLLSPSKNSRLFLPRIFVSVFCMSQGMKLKEVGRLLERGHSTVVYHLKCYEKEKDIPSIKTQYDEFVRLLLEHKNTMDGQ